MNAVSVDSKTLRGGLARVLPCIRKHSPKAELECVRLRVREMPPGDSAVLELSGTDLELAGMVEIPRVGPAGAFDLLLSARDLYAALRGRDGPVEIRWDGVSEAKLHFGAEAQMTMPAIPPPDHFPTISLPPPHIPLWRIDMAAFARAFAEVRPFVVAGQSRYAINGIQVEAGPEGLDIIATDTHRLSHIRIPPVDPPDENADAKPVSGLFLPAVAAFLAAAPGGERPLLAIGERSAWVVGRDYRFFARLIDGQFPDWRRVVPSLDRSTSPRLIVNRPALLAALKSLPGNYLDLTPANGGDGVRLTTAFGVRDDDYSGPSGMAVAQAFSEKMPDRVCFSRMFLLEALNVSDRDLVTILMPHDGVALLEPRQDHLHLICPAHGGDKKPPRASTSERGAKSLKVALTLPDRPPIVDATPPRARRPRPAYR